MAGLLLAGCGGAGHADLPDGSAVADLAQLDLSTAPPADLTTFDSARPDLSLPDLAAADLSLADLSMPDLAMPDLSTPDLAMPDLSMPDLAPPLDLTVVNDLTVLRDFAVVQDLTRIDLTPPADLRPPVDFSIPDVVRFVPGVMVSTFAGSDTPGAMDGNGSGVQLDNPTGLALDAAGNLYVAEYDGARVRRIDPLGTSSTPFAGQANFLGPFAIAVVGGVVYVQTDYSPSGAKTLTSGTIWKVAGGVATSVVGGLGRPRGLAALSGGRLAVADKQQFTVGVLDPSLTPATVMPLAGMAGSAGYVDQNGTSARFAQPYGSATLADGSVLVADLSNHTIRRVAPDGTVSTYAGEGDPGTIDGPRLSARFVGPKDVTVDAAGRVYVTDQDAHRIRRIDIDVAGTVTTLAGDGVAGFADGAGNTAEFYGQESIEITPDGKTLYVSDGNSGDFSAHHRIRKVSIP